jgi:hypothetical protein
LQLKQDSPAKGYRVNSSTLAGGWLYAAFGSLYTRVREATHRDDDEAAGDQQQHQQQQMNDISAIEQQAAGSSIQGITDGW